MTGLICKHSSLRLLYGKEGISQGWVVDLHILSPQNVRERVSQHAERVQPKVNSENPTWPSFGVSYILIKSKRL